MTRAMLRHSTWATQSSPHLVVSCSPFQGESAAGFLQRCCEANVLPSCRDLLNLVEQTCGVRVTDVPHLALSVEALQSLARIAGAQPDSLESLAMRELTGATGIFLRQGLHEWPEDARLSDAQQVCPSCLREAGFGRTAWEFVQAPVCLVHGQALMSACPECHEPLRFGRTVLCRCGACGHDLGGAAISPVCPEALAAGHLVQTPRMVGLGTQDYNAPIDALELSALLRLCLLPRLGEPVDFGLRLRLDGYPTERRLDALGLLGSAIKNGYLDSNLLRATLLRRWPYAPRLSHELQTSLLVDASRRVELSQEVQRLVCHGTDAEPYVAAAEVFGGKPPHITDMGKLASHLGVDASMLRQLMSIEHVSTQPAPEMGYDMDEILTIQRTLNSLWTLEQADQAFGCPGLTKALVNLKILDSIRDEGEIVWLHPTEVGTLFARVHQSVSVKPSNAHAVALSAGSLNFDVERIAWAVSQALTGSLEVLGWDWPHGLMDLLVDGDRLRQLADWPLSEATRHS